MKYNIEHATLTVPFDNYSLHKYCEKELDIEEANYSNINQLIAHVRSSFTLGERFNQNIMNCNMKDI